MLHHFSCLLAGSVLGKMAEVGQRLGSGAYRLSALRNNQSRPVCTGESPASLLGNCPLSDNRLKDKSSRDHQREVQPESKRRATQRKSEKLSRVRTSGSQQENGTLRCATSLKLDTSRFIGESLQAHTTALYLSAGLQPLLQEKLLPGSMTCWTRGAVSVHPDTFRSRHQLRAFCTVLFILAEQRSEKPWRPKLHPDTLQASSRSYSWRSGSSSEDTPPLYRSRTSYYDILRVSPSATQSQVKTAYYKQSFIHHPDKNQGNKEAAQRFSDISEAYAVLGNISLRKKYDRGILRGSDVQSAGRPSSKETTSRFTGSPQHHQYRARRFSQAGGKTMFNFDAFYQAHYGEQLQREREMRARKQHMEEQQKENFRKWRQGKMLEMTVAMLLTMAGFLFVNLSRS
ncbi:dnaJ (Hsp40) homolog, subfamily C, member 30b [Perca flavescens]|uniref:dnaJ (Hsp40) homolog, subfamily C, member 30b n=1 Tax=Perca flavescens TaxID=8167 RepID=UPI00106E2B51|nr:dnaJ homolog subfamily C member 30, mitochondrial [Perca flavescens]